MFFDRNLYLPRKRQLEYYIPIHKLFLKNNTITYKKSLENLRSLLEELKNISKNIVLDENVRVFKEKLMKTSRFFNIFLPAIVQLSALKLTRMISLLFYPQKGGFIPPPAVASWFIPGRRLYYRFLSWALLHAFIWETMCALLHNKVYFLAGEE